MDVLEAPRRRSLTPAGIYALMAFTITRRRREIGIRSALGAGPSRVLRSILARAVAQISSGIAIGLAAGALMRQGGVGALDERDVILLISVAVLMAVVGIAAAFGPARRALGIQPTEALRAE